MFDAVRKYPKIAQGALALITVPFLFFGLDSFMGSAGDADYVATVGKGRVSGQEFQAALREQQERIRAQMGGSADPALMNSQPVRRAVLDSLVSRRLMAMQVDESHLRINDGDLANFIASVPALQEGGKFSPERYAALVANQGMSKEGFEVRLRQDLALQQLVLPIGDAAISSKAGGQLWAAAELEQREVSEATLTPAAFVSKVKLADNAVTTFYEANRKKFESPEQIRVEYLTLSRNDMLAQVTVTDGEIKARYESQAEKYRETETRRASHVLIKLAKDASDADVKAAQTKAEGILAQLKKKPADFATVAKAQSQDPGSADKGGDLDWFGRGMMVKAFEDAAFTLKENEMSELVRSDFGIHIIRVTGVRAERVKPFEAVKAQIADELKMEAAARRFAEASEAFGNTVYEESDSLKPAADKWKLTVQQSGWMQKGAPLPPPFDSSRLATAIFSEDSVAKKRNTEAVEIAAGPLKGALVSARVLEHKPANLQPLEQVRDAISRQLIAEEAAKLAVREGEARLDKLVKGEAAEAIWSSPRVVVRANPAGMPPDGVRAVFKASGFKLPAYAGAILPQGGYAIYRINSIKPAAADDARAASLAQQYARVVAEQEFGAWMETMRQRYPVVINKSVLENKEP